MLNFYLIGYIVASRWLAMGSAAQVNLVQMTVGCILKCHEVKPYSSFCAEWLRIVLIVSLLSKMRKASDSIPVGRLDSRVQNTQRVSRHSQHLTVYPILKYYKIKNTWHWNRKSIANKFKVEISSVQLHGVHSKTDFSEAVHQLWFALEVCFRKTKVTYRDSMRW